MKRLMMIAWVAVAAGLVAAPAAPKKHAAPAAPKKHLVAAGLTAECKLWYHFLVVQKCTMQKRTTRDRTTRDRTTQMEGMMP